MKNELSNNDFYQQIIDLLQKARKRVLHTINKTMVETYYEIGRRIVVNEQDGKERAEYGKEVIKNLSFVLSKEFGKGFSARNLEQMRQFFLVYSKTQTLSAELENKSQTPSAKSSKNESKPDFSLSWSHYLTLMRMDNPSERKFYEIEASKNNWSIRELKRQYNSALYTRLVLSKDKAKVKELSEKGLILNKPKDAVKDPYILEFLGLPEKPEYSESQLEEQLISKIGTFLLELGNGFSFVARQKRISFDDKHFRIDLVFYNRILQCFVLIDLKVGELKHQDLGQMQMYVNYYDREIKMKEENKTIGIVLCQNKSDAVVEFTLPESNENIFAGRYKTVLPTKEELKLLIEQNKK
ncbi:MAG: DUF1016 domain-containing protein [Brumimicrobium sp.]|nr:DUF1016 domain-containing protein [Brumimicrobium sp.]